ncbi:MAG: hypothetical protein M1818_004486 [Claussenomyces sp. TS43310]|nr:MAG: hypothetical protein M1818_004486 [Claussenomyces sp. TS43310]
MSQAWQNNVQLWITLFTAAMMVACVISPWQRQRPREELDAHVRSIKDGFTSLCKDMKIRARQAEKRAALETPRSAKLLLRSDRRPKRIRKHIQHPLSFPIA